jgi:hypothetical protein
MVKTYAEMELIKALYANKKEAVILSAAKDLLRDPTSCQRKQILRCAQDDSSWASI